MKSTLRWWLFSIITVAVAVFGLLRLKIDTQPASLFPTNIKEAKGLGLFLRHFAHEGELVVMLDQAAKPELMSASEVIEKALKARPDLVARVMARSPWEDEPKEMVDFLAFSLLNLPQEKLTKLEAGLQESTAPATLQASLESLADSLTMEENLAGYDPLGLAKLVMAERSRGFGSFDGFSSPDGRVRLLIVEAANPKVHYREKFKWLGEVRQVINQALAQAPPEAAKVRARLTGEPAFMGEISVGMENDMKGSGISTLVLSAILFFLIYRSLKPLLFINAALILVVLLTLGFCGWIMGSVTVFCAGFASILIGLTIDYGVLIYEDAKNSGLGQAELRKHCGRSILAAAGTTSVAFLAMRASSLPGLQELGVLLSVGVMVGAAVMLIWFAQWLGPKPTLTRGWLEWEGNPRILRILPSISVVAIAIAILGVFIKGIPDMDASPDTLRPRECEAQDTMTDLIEAMSGDRTGKSLLVYGKTHEEVAEKLGELSKIIAEGTESGAIHKHALPGPVWPSATAQKANLAPDGPATKLLNATERLRSAVLAAGFSPDAFAMANGVFEVWKRWQANGTYPLWPEAIGSKWTLARFHKQTDDGVYALGVLQTKPDHPASEPLVLKIRQLDGVYVLSDGVVLTALKERLPIETIRITIALAIGMLAMLIWTFRSWWPITLCLVNLLISLLALQGIMSWFDIRWNLLNLAGLILCLGTGVDYGIHALLSLRRNAGDIPAMQRTTGRALLLCALSSIIGFGSLSWAGNKGLASLGVVCSIALSVSLVTSLFILPHVWKWKKDY